MNDQHEASITLQSHDAQLARFTQANELHEQCCRDGLSANEHLLAQVNSARKCGEILNELRKSAKGEQWEQSFMDFQESAPIKFTAHTGDIYMRIARRSNGEITDITEALAIVKEAKIATGELFPSQGHGAQALHSFNFLGLIEKKTFDFQAAWGKHIKSDPIDQWTESRKESARMALKWFAEQYQALGGRL